MNKSNNNGIIIVGAILAVLVILRTIQLVILIKNKCYRPCKPLKHCKDVVIADYDDDFDSTSTDVDHETSNKETINKED